MPTSSLQRKGRTLVVAPSSPTRTGLPFTPVARPGDSVVDAVTTHHKHPAAHGEVGAREVRMHEHILTPPKVAGMSWPPPHMVAESVIHRYDTE